MAKRRQGTVSISVILSVGSYIVPVSFDKAKSVFQDCSLRYLSHCCSKVVKPGKEGFILAPSWQGSHASRTLWHLGM